MLCPQLFVRLLPMTTTNRTLYSFWANVVPRVLVPLNQRSGNESACAVRGEHSRHHSCLQRPHPCWSAPRIATSGKAQHRKSAIHGLPVTLRMLRVKSDKSDWLSVRNEYSAHAQKIGPGQRSRFLVLTKRSAASGDENVSARDWI